MRLRLIRCIFSLLNRTKRHYSTETWSTDMVAFSLKCPFNAPPNRRHSKYRRKAILQGEFSGCKGHTQPSSEMNKTRVTKWCVRQTTITLSIAPAPLLSPLRAEEKREKPLSTWDREAKCSCYLSSSNSEPAKPTSGSCRKWKWSEVILSPYFC